MASSMRLNYVPNSSDDPRCLYCKSMHCFQCEHRELPIVEDKTNNKVQEDPNIYKPHPQYYEPYFYKSPTPTPKSSGCCGGSKKSPQEKEKEKLEKIRIKQLRKQAQLEEKRSHQKQPISNRTINQTHPYNPSHYESSHPFERQPKIFHDVPTNKTSQIKQNQSQMKDEKQNYKKRNQDNDKLPKSERHMQSYRETQYERDDNPNNHYNQSTSNYYGNSSYQDKYQPFQVKLTYEDNDNNYMQTRRYDPIRKTVYPEMDNTKDKTNKIKPNIDKKEKKGKKEKK